MDVLVRVGNQRHWIREGRGRRAQEIAGRISLKYRGSLRGGGGKSIRFGMTRVWLPGHPDRPLSMVVVRHGKQEPMVLVSTRLVRGRRQGERLIHSYLHRWSCEEGYRFEKQGFGLERVQARSYTTLRNLVALATAAWALLAAHQHQANVLLLKARRLKKKPPKFPFYSLLKGWQHLFAQAKTMLYHRLRSPAPPHVSNQLPLFPHLLPKL